MLVCIDESGCAGFKLDKGSTPYFVVALVLFHEFGQAERTSAKIAQMRGDLRVKPEFKFSKCSNDYRTRFFKGLADHEFRIRAIVVDKKRIYSSYLRNLPDAFYSFIVQTVLKHNNSVLKDARIKIDGSGDRRFRRELYSYLRRQLPAGTLKSLKFANSKSDNLIQLADMSAGAIARSYPGRNGRSADPQWRRLLVRQIDNVWEFR